MDMRHNDDVNGVLGFYLGVAPRLFGQHAQKAEGFMPA
jgi:hypothetical protein